MVGDASFAASARLWLARGSGCTGACRACNVWHRFRRMMQQALALLPPAQSDAPALALPAPAVAAPPQPELAGTPALQLQ